MEKKIKTKFFDKIKALVGLNYKFKDHVLDDIVFFYLKVLVDIFEDNKSVVDIASSLSILLPNYKKEDVAEILSRQFFFAEQKLEKKLQGFSRLLEDILDDYDLSLNKEYQINKLKFLDEDLKSNMIFVSNCLDVYTDLNKAFLVKDRSVCTMLFLLGIDDYLSCSSFMHKWLVQRKKNLLIADMFSIFRTFSKRKLFNYCSQNKDFAKTFILVWLCRKITKDGLIKNEEATLIEHSLKSLELFEFNDLLELGFLCLSDEHKEVNHKNVLKMARFC